MAGSLADLFVKIGADTSDLTNGLKSGLADATSTLGTFGSTATLVGGAAVAALAAVGAAAFKVGTDFQDATATLRAGTGATGQALEDLKVSAKNVFAEVPNSIQEVSATMADLATTTGLTGKPLEDLTKQFLDLKDLPAGFGGDVTKLTRVFGDWSVATEDQSKTLDFFFKTSQNTAVGVDKLADTVVQFGAPLRQLGFTFEQSTALIGKFGKEGVNTETVFSGLRFALGQFGKAGLDAKDAFASTVDAIKTAGSESEATSIAFKVFGQRAANDMAAAIREGRFEIDDFVKSLSESTETIATADEATETLGEKFDVLGNRVSLLLEPLGSFLVDSLTSVVDVILGAFNPAAEGVAGAFSSINEFLQPLIQSMTQALGPAFEFIAGLAISLGSAIIDLNVQAYTPLLNILGKVAGFIRDVLIYNFQQMAAGIDLIVKGLKLIPGVASLVDSGLEKIGRSASSVATETGKAAKATADAGKALSGTAKSAEAGGKALGGAGKSASGLKIDFDKLGKSTKEVKEKFDDLPKPMRYVLQTEEDLEKQTDKIRDQWRKLRNEELRDLISDFPVFSAAIDDTAAAAFQAISDMDALTGALSTQAIDLGKVNIEAINLENAYKTLGITSKDVADNNLKAMGDAVAVIRAEVEAGRLPVEELQKAIDKYNQAAGTGATKTGLWGDALTQVSTVVTDFGKQFVTDFGAKLNTGIAIVDNLKDAFLRLVSEQVMGAVLKNFKGLSDFIPSLTKIKDIFNSIKDAVLGIGNATNIATQPFNGGNIPGGGSPAPSGGGGGSPPIGGGGGGGGFDPLAIVNAAANTISAIWTVRQEGTMNQIERNTAQAALFLGSRGDGGITTSNLKILELTGYNVASLDDIKATLWNIRDMFREGIVVAGMATVVASGMATADNTGATAQNTEMTAVNTETAFEIPEKIEDLGTKLTGVWEETSTRQTESIGQDLSEIAQRLNQALNPALPGPIRGRTRTPVETTETGSQQLPIGIRGRTRIPIDIPQADSGQLPLGVRGRTRIAVDNAVDAVVDPFLEELRRRNPLAFGSNNPLASILLGGRDPLNIEAGFQGLNETFNESQDILGSSLDALREQQATLERIATGIEAQEPSFNITIENLYGTDQRAVDTFTREIEKRLRNTTRGLR